MKQGQQKKIPTPGQQQKTHLFGAYDWHTDTVHWLIKPTQDSSAFIDFLCHLLLHCYSQQRLILVLDNAPFHTSAMAQAALSLFEDRVLIIWLPKYCSTELKPIERYWKHLKEQVCVNKLFATMETLTDSVVNELKRQADNTYPKRFAFLK